MSASQPPPGTTGTNAPVRVEFGSKLIADSFREDHADHLAPADDARTRTVTFQADTPEVALDRAEVAALETTAEREGGFGQVALTDHERQQIDFSKGRANVPHARAVKAALTKQGVDDWLAHYDPTLTVDEHVGDVAERGKGGGAARERDPDDPDVLRERATSAARASGQECEHARGFCKMGDIEACEFLTEHCDVAEAELDALRDADPDDGAITGRALGALRRAWGGYQGAIRQAEAAASPDDAEAHLEHARQASEAINAVRDRHGQDPLTFHRLEEVGAEAEAIDEPDDVLVPDVIEDPGETALETIEASPGDGVDDGAGKAAVVAVGALALLALAARAAGR